MDFRGLIFSATGLSWTTGFIFLQKPWGSPILKSWFSLHTIWSVTILIIQHCLLYNFLRQTSVFNSLAVNPLAQSLHSIMFLAAYIAFWSVRLVFAVQARNIANLLHSLYNYPFQIDTRKWRKVYWMANAIISISSVFAIVSSIVFTLAFKERPKADEGSWLNSIGTVGSRVVGSFFGHLATMAATNCSFALIIFVSFYLVIIFSDFCEQVEDALKHSDLGNEFLLSQDFVVRNKLQRNKTNIFFHIPLTRDVLLRKFESIQMLFTAADKIIPPLVLVVIVIDTFRMVSGAHEILINKLGGLFLMESYITLIEQLVHTSLVLVGQFITDQIKICKKKLQKLVTLLPKSTENQEIVAFVALVLDFDWKLSACGFFHVDKKLLSGIMATAMTYILILVQLQISIQSNITNLRDTNQTNGINVRLP